MSSVQSVVERAADGKSMAPPAVMLDVEHVAELLGVSSRHVRRLVDAGKCPPPCRLGRACRWPRQVVEAWIADGCPSNCRRRQGGAR
jgi:excisionase family DNA binding protein